MTYMNRLNSNGLAVNIRNAEGAPIRIIRSRNGKFEITCNGVSRIVALMHVRTTLLRLDCFDDVAEDAVFDLA